MFVGFIGYYKKGYVNNTLYKFNSNFLMWEIGMCKFIHCVSPFLRDGAGGSVKIAVQQSLHY